MSQHRKPFARNLIVPAVFAAVVASLWAFPAVWYDKKPQGKVYWFGERTELPGWEFKAVPIADSAEKVLVADRTVNGEFDRAGEAPVRVFSAKRYEEKANEIGLFVHTPDRCWVETGWSLEPAEPEVKEVPLHGITVPVERRIFSSGGERELVYFCGLVGGQPLPYRLDHNLSVGLRSSKSHGGKNGAGLRASDAHFWERLWESFESRREFTGPKQFIRISTPIGAEKIESADARLERFLEDWLAPVDYASDKEAWQRQAKK